MRAWIYHLRGGSSLSPPPTPPSSVTPDIYVDSRRPDNAGDGLSPATAKRDLTAGILMLSSTRKVIGLARNSSYNQKLSLTGSAWQGVTLCSYGTGALPVLRNSIFRTPISAGSNRWYVQVPAGSAFPQLTGMTAMGTGNDAERIKTNIIVVDGTQHCYERRTSIGAVTNTTHLFHDTAADGSGNGRIYFYKTTTPASVEIPMETPIDARNIDDLTIREIEVASARDHAIIAANCNRLSILNNYIHHCGFWGVYVQSRHGGTLSNLTVSGNTSRFTHCGFISISSPSGFLVTPNTLQGIVIENNTVEDYCLGAPIIATGNTSDDFYAAGIKLYSGPATGMSWTGRINNNTLNRGGATVYIGVKTDQGSAIWLDTCFASTTSGIDVYNNTINRTYSGGILVELCRATRHRIYNNLIIDTGYIQESGGDDPNYDVGYCGSITVHRGSTHTEVFNNTVDQARVCGLLIQSLANNDWFTGLSQLVTNCVIRDNIFIAKTGRPINYGKTAIWELRINSNPLNSFSRNLLWPSMATLVGYSPNAVGYAPTVYYPTATAWDSGRGVATNSLVANPLFVNPAAGDYSLQAGSPCRNASTTNGNIGAF